ncbi:MAG: hypothetical protein M0P13_08185 [Fibrobacteraceae bacterium]|nr:hypothetical protein [Fibrobacteraceae bacterium]
MKKKILVVGLFALLAAGCAGNKEFVSSSIGNAEGMSKAAKTEKIMSKTSAEANKDLAEAKNLNENGKTDDAYDAAVRSVLEFRLAFALAENKAAVLADSASSKELAGDMQSQKLYQNILDNESRVKEEAK